MCAAAAASIGIGVGASQQRRRLTTTSKMVTTADALTPYDAVTQYNNFYEYGEDKDDPARYANAFTAAPWTVEVTGECAKPGRYAIEDILRPHPLEERVYRMRCVEGWSMVIPWVGFPLRDLVRRLEPNGECTIRRVHHRCAVTGDDRSAPPLP